MRATTFFSLNGGCGKTMSCVNIAAAPAEMGRRMLVADLDSTAWAWRAFGVVAGPNYSVGANLLAQHSLNMWLRSARRSPRQRRAVIQVADSCAARQVEAKLRQLPPLSASTLAA